MRSLTETELVDVHNAKTQMLWFTYFIHTQGHKEKIKLYQDNMKSVLLDQNRKELLIKNI